MDYRIGELQDKLRKAKAQCLEFTDANAKLRACNSNLEELLRAHGRKLEASENANATLSWRLSEAHRLQAANAAECSKLRSDVRAHVERLPHAAFKLRVWQALALTLAIALMVLA